MQTLAGSCVASCCVLRARREVIVQVLLSALFVMKKLFNRTSRWILNKVFRQFFSCGIPAMCYSKTTLNDQFFCGICTMSSASHSSILTMTNTYPFPRAFHDFTTCDIEGENFNNISCQSNDNVSHIPVMVEEVLSILNPKVNQVRIKTPIFFFCFFTAVKKEKKK